MNQKTTLIAAVAICSAAAFLAGRISIKLGEPASSPSSSSNAISPHSSSDFPSRSQAPRGFRAAQSNARDRSPSLGATYSANPLAHMMSIMNQADPMKRAEEWLRFVKGLNTDEIESVVAKFRGEGLTGNNRSEYAILLHAWARTDPYGALDYAEANTRSTFARETILSSWATTDPQSAIRWAEEHHSGKGANQLMVGVIRGIAANDPQLATQLMTAMPYSTQRAQALNSVYVHYLNQGPEVAREWAMSIPDEQLRIGAITRIAEGLATTDPRGAADWLVANPGDGATAAMDKVMERMTLADPQSAIGYMETISDPALKGRALEGIANKLSAIDPYATLSVIDAHPELVRDDIVRELIWGARRKEPALGANTIARIQDERIRNRTYYRYIAQWIQVDLEGASGWVSQNELPSSISNAVTKMVERRKLNERGP